MIQLSKAHSDNVDCYLRVYASPPFCLTHTLYSQKNVKEAGDRD